MPVSVTMPRLGESVTEGTVTRWLKQEGDAVAADEPLLEVSTDKVDTEVPSPASGVLTSIKVAEDETVEIGVELAIISDSSEAPAPAAEAAPAAQTAPAPAPAAGAATATAAAADTPNFSSMSLMSCESSRTVMLPIASRISCLATAM